MKSFVEDLKKKKKWEKMRSPLSYLLRYQESSKLQTEKNVKERKFG